MFFLFQAEDCIRYGHVTGVQTCALPIYWLGSDGGRPAEVSSAKSSPVARVPNEKAGTGCAVSLKLPTCGDCSILTGWDPACGEIGRASCRATVEMLNSGGEPSKEKLTHH